MITQEALWHYDHSGGVMITQEVLWLPTVLLLQPLSRIMNMSTLFTVSL